MSFITVPSAVTDNSTLSSYKSVDLEHTTLDLSINWDDKILAGSVTHVLKSELKSVVLDTSFLKIDKVEWQNKVVKHDVADRDSFRGSALTVRDIEVGVVGELKIYFSTTKDCTGLQWLSPEQTIGKKAPFLFSQCEPTHARSIFPCFDTPSIKVPYKFDIDSKYPVLVSGTRTVGSKFEQKVPIPSYLFAIASGNLKSKVIGLRSHVWAEPEIVDSCQWEFEADTELQLEAAEKLLFKYEWGSYDVLVLPPSFPFGGMENPNITFATPTIVSGDRTLVNVIAHELAHSWSGNLVTNSTWGHFWLNEGWTVYIERRILGQLHGEPYRHFAAIEGWQDLENAINVMPAEYTKLVMDVASDVDPDDTFSTVPYEKGSTFLWYLENLVGRSVFDDFMKKYFQAFKYKSLDSFKFKEFFIATVGDASASVDWDAWFYNPGLPPKPQFNDELLRVCAALSDKWTSPANVKNSEWKKWASKTDISGWRPLQVIVFLNLVTDKLGAIKTDANCASAIADLGAIYEIGQSRNAEIKFRWLQLAVKAGVQGTKEALAQWIAEVGRMKFVRPGYRLLNEVDRELAVSTFEKNKTFYHAICRAMVEKDLGL